MRRCGRCGVCCEIADVPGLGFPKPAGTMCPHFLAGCRIHADPRRPEVCRTFGCAWLHGMGLPRHRPDRCGTMVTVNKANGGTWVFVMDTVKHAHRTTGLAIVRAVVEHVRFPAVVVDADSAVLSKGDFVMLTEDMVPRASQMTGDFVGIFGSLREYHLAAA